LQPERVFGRQPFVAKARFHNQGALHHVAIECTIEGDDDDIDMAIGIDNEAVALALKHLQWKFKGSQSVLLGRAKARVLGRARLALRRRRYSYSTPSCSRDFEGASTPLLAGVDGATGATGFCLYLLT
jgi:hypothetical protein